MAKALAQFNSACLRRRTLPVFIHDFVTIYCVNNFYKLYVARRISKWMKKSNTKRKEKNAKEFPSWKRPTNVLCICCCVAAYTATYTFILRSQAKVCLFLPHIYITAMMLSPSAIHFCVYINMCCLYHITTANCNTHLYVCITRLEAQFLHCINNDWYYHLTSLSTK